MFILFIIPWFGSWWDKAINNTIKEFEKLNLQKEEQRELAKPTKIYRYWRSEYDDRQKIVQYTYNVWWMDQVILHECENSERTLDRLWDWWDAIWLCQINRRWHNPPIEFYNDYEVHIDYCYKKRQWWTLFYGPERKNLDWIMCKDYVKERFYFK